MALHPYEFPRAAETNHHKFGDFKMEAGSKIKVSAGPHSLEGSRGRPFLASSKLVRLLASLPVLGSYVQRPQPPPLSSLGILPVSVCLWSHSSLLMKLPVVGLGPTPILYDHI